MDVLLSAPYAPFTAALIGVVILLVLELLGLLLAGAGPSHVCEMVFHAHTFPESAATNWLSLRDVPISLVLVLAFAGFGTTGYLVQSATDGVWPMSAVICAAVLGALVVLRVASPQIAKLFRMHTTAVSELALVGRVATLLTPTAAQGYAGEAKLQDEFGQTHYVMVEPVDPAGKFTEGQRVKLVEARTNKLYRACATDV